MIDTNLFIIIALILLSTKALALFMRRIHLPQVIGALIAGVLLGPAVFGLAEPNETISMLAEFGVIFLLFSAGMETDFQQLRSSFKAALLISVLGIAAALGGGFAIAFAFGKPTFESFFIGVVIASMSTSITVEALQEMGKLKSKSGTAILGASLFDDIIVIVILAVAMGMGDGGFSASSMAILLVKIVAFFLFAVLAGLGVNRLFNYMHSRFGEKKRLAIFAVAYCFLMAYLAEQFGLADITGAYIAGIAFCNTKCVEYLEIKSHVLSYMLFTPIFLANIGFHTSFAGMTGSVILFTVLLVAVSIFSKLIGCGLGAKISRFTNRESMQVGAGMIARGEVSFIVASKGIAAGYISSLLFPSIIVIVLVTVLITPLLLKVVYRK
ncbi:MAG: cation:proton antiporter [Oscillospiraceae bacterium]|jgi:Kef-type K+ transport system membrane component KefB|nr:cation:proton antiporter [Oscillospiraceae bacterium]